jgi:hypothetical protein
MACGAKLVDWLVAAGTIGATLVALFGQAFRDKFFPPKLTLRLVSSVGEKALAEWSVGTRSGTG